MTDGYSIFTNEWGAMMFLPNEWLKPYPTIDSPEKDWRRFVSIARFILDF